MSSFAYYQSVVKHNRKGNRSDKFVTGVRAVLAAYWRVKREGKLPPLSADDLDEAMDRVMEKLAPALRRYDPTIGAPIEAFVGQVMRYAWLRAAHAVAQETERYQTNVFDVDADNSTDHAAHDAIDDSGLNDFEEDGQHQLTYASPPIGFGNPMDEAANLQHIELLEKLAADEDAAAYREATGASRNKSHSRKRTLTLRDSAA